VSTRIHLTDLGLWPVFIGLYETWMTEHRPSRAVVGVSELDYGVGLEMEVVALHYVNVDSIRSNGVVVEDARPGRAVLGGSLPDAVGHSHDLSRSHG
jgi:hypothetical protein